MAFQSPFWQCWIVQIPCLYVVCTWMRKSRAVNVSCFRFTTFVYSFKKSEPESNEGCVTLRKVNNKLSCWKKWKRVNRKSWKMSTVNTKSVHKTAFSGRSSLFLFCFWLAIEKVDNKLTNWNCRVLISNGTFSTLMLWYLAFWWFLCIWFEWNCSRNSCFFSSKRKIRKITKKWTKITLSNFGLVLNGNWVYVIIDFEANKRRMLNEWAIIKIMSSLKRIQSEYQLFLFSRIFRGSKRIVINN